MEMPWQNPGHYGRMARKTEQEKPEETGKMNTSRKVLLLVLQAAAVAAVLLFAALGFHQESIPLRVGDMSPGFRDNDLSFVEYDENWGWVFDPEEGNMNTTYIKTLPVKLAKGDYQVVLTYSCDEDQRAFFYDANDEGYIRPGDKLAMESGRTRMTVNSRMLADTPNFQVVVEYNGSGEMTLENIEIFTSPAGITRLAVWLLLLFALMDAVLFARAGTQRLHVCCILGITLLSSVPLLMEGMVRGHDYAFHFMRIEAIASGLAGGLFPVRISPVHFNGFGYATSVFYGDIFLYFPALLRLAGFGMAEAYKGFVLMVNLAGALIADFSFRQITADRWKGLLLSLVYNTFTYRIVDLYVRMAVGEYCALAFFPLVAAGVWRLMDRDAPRFDLTAVLELAFGFSGIVLSHILSVEMTGILLVLVCLLLLRRTLRPRTFGQFALAAALTLLLCAFFVVPFMDYMVNMPVHVTNVKAADNTRIQIEGSYVTQLFAFFQSPYGGVSIHHDGRIGESPGFILTGALLAALLLLAWGKGSRRMAFLSCMALVPLFMCTHVFPWNDIEKLGKIGEVLCQVQFSWRYIGLAAVFMTLLLPMVCDAVPQQARGIVYGGVVCMCLVSTAVFAGQTMVEPGYINPYDMAELAGSDDVGGGGEYLPYNLQTGKQSYDERFALAPIVDGENFEYLQIDERTPDGVVMYVKNGGEEMPLDLPLFYYRDYEARLDDGTVKSLSLGINNRARVMVPAGYDGHVTVRFAEPALWRAALWVSVLTLAGVIFAAIAKGRKRRGTVQG